MKQAIVNIMSAESVKIVEVPVFTTGIDSKKHSAKTGKPTNAGKKANTDAATSQKIEAISRRRKIVL